VTEAETANVGEWAGSHSPIVVAVDGSEGSRSALAWASREAVAAGADLRLLAVADAHALTPPFPVRLGRSAAARVLDELLASLDGVVPREQVDSQLLEGETTSAILDHLDHARLLAVGKRGLGAIPRLLVGSTSLALAGRSPIPVAVVPTGWDCEAHDTEPVVVGIDPLRPHGRLLHLAFRRAQRLGVPLVVVHGWEAPSAPAWNDEPIDGWEREAHERFRASVEPWGKRFPEVDLRLSSSSHHPAIAVLDEAEKGAQLVILGRHAASRFTGFVFGSVTRAVLHYAAAPVLVVPTAES
jgi:nucleotide-binding universal stress UspA family protein